MQLETKYGILKGDSEEFKSLFKDKTTLHLETTITSEPIRHIHKKKGGRRNKHWSKSEISKIKKLKAQGYAKRTIAKKLKRTTKAVAARIWKMEREND